MKRLSTSVSSSALNLFLVRHGETDWNRQKRVQGQRDIPLNEYGIRQAQALAEKFRPLKLAAIYSSPLARALQTAELINSGRDLLIDRRSEFREIDHGLWEGLTAPELRERFAEKWRAWLDCPRRAVLPGGERLAEVEERVLAGIEAVRKRHRAGETILLVAHEAVNRVLLCSFLGWGMDRFRFLKQGNTAVNLVKFYSSHTQVCLLNDTCHDDKTATI